MKIIFPDEERRKEYARVPHPTTSESVEALGLLPDSHCSFIYRAALDGLFEKNDYRKNKKAAQKAFDGGRHASDVVWTAYKLGTSGAVGHPFLCDDLKDIVRRAVGYENDSNDFINRAFGKTTFGVDVPRKVHWVNTHQEFLYTLTWEVLRNAVHSHGFSGYSKGIDIGSKLYLDDSGYKISVSDNGNGIPEEYVGRLFDHGTFEIKRGGSSCHHYSGLGFAEEMLYFLDSRMVVETEKRKGTTFTIAIRNLPEMERLSIMEERKKRYDGNKSLLLFKNLPEKVGKITGSGKIEHVGGNYYAATGNYIDRLKYSDDLKKSGGESLRLFYGINDRATDLLLENYGRTFEKEKVIMYSDLKRIDYLIDQRY